MARACWIWCRACQAPFSARSEGALEKVQDLRQQIGAGCIVEEPDSMDTPWIHLPLLWLRRQVIHTLGVAGERLVLFARHEELWLSKVRKVALGELYVLPADGGRDRDDCVRRLQT